ncbi:hypothetical protein FRC15_011069 [Serendipita sp. 397]|nr:hypothetical protein FRC15_011069 [Serendipita sp. 397]
MGKGELSEESPDEQAGNQQSSHRPSGQVHTTTSGNRQMMANKSQSRLRLQYCLPKQSGYIRPTVTHLQSTTLLTSIHP